MVRLKEGQVVNVLLGASAFSRRAKVVAGPFEKDGEETLYYSVELTDGSEVDVPEDRIFGTLKRKNNKKSC